MSFIDARFPECIMRYGYSASQDFAVEIATMGDHHEQRNLRTRYGRWRFRFDASINRDDFADLSALYRSARGSLRPFRFHWPDDFEARDELIATGDGVTREFQLYRRYQVEGDPDPYLHKITKPLDGTLRVYVGGIDRVTGWTANPLTGVVTFSVAPAAGDEIRADFDFDYVVRFDGEAPSIARLPSRDPHYEASFDLLEVPHE